MEGNIFRQNDLGEKLNGASGSDEVAAQFSSAHLLVQVIAVPLSASQRQLCTGSKH